MQDYLFRAVAAEAGRLGLVVHVRTGSGWGKLLDNRGADPMLLDSVLNDPALRKTQFVLLHGGVPFDRRRATRRFIVKPNVSTNGGGAVLGLLHSADEVARMNPAVARHAAGTRHLRQRCRAVRRRHGLGRSHVDGHRESGTRFSASRSPNSSAIAQSRLTAPKSSPRRCCATTRSRYIS